MSRYEQRRRQRLENPDVLAGYREADAELELLAAINRARATLGVSQTDLAESLGRSQSAVSQFLGGNYSVSVEAIADYLHALGLQARIQIVQANEGDPSLVVDSGAVTAV